MFRNLVASALFAGLTAGVVAFALQQWLVVPVLMEAELYESGIKTHFAGVEGADTHAMAGTHQHGDADAQATPSDGHDHHHEGAAPTPLKRHALTFFADLVTFTGFALLLVACYAFAGTRGIAITPRAGLIWGLCGFLAVHIAPAVGLAPELPGSSAADVTMRGIWWAGTVVATAAGLGAIAFGKGPGPWIIGAALILLPHIIGAPQPDMLAGVAPPELAGEFAGRALGANAAIWAVLGLMSAWFWTRSKS